MPFDVIIDPEVRADSLARFLYQAARQIRRGAVLEIGSSDGRGSTAQLVQGLIDAVNLPEETPNVRLACLELDRVRYAALVQRYAHLPWVHPYRGLATSLDDQLTEAQVGAFYRQISTNLNRYPLAEVLRWRTEERAYAVATEAPEEQLAAAAVDLDVDRWALAFLDGSPFSGQAELADTLPAALVVLDDVLDIKNYANYQALLTSPDWQLVDRDLTLRNGWAAFRSLTGGY